ncbi:hypothetical protein [Sorangium sp. So ce1097]|uniref:hypothetical protein n=1 Tax=Sorangium sp. So ce1097 TaxID=3133330 RepID=UPI003F61D82C
MNDEEIVEKLRESRGLLTAVELAELLAKLTGGKLSQGTMITYFKRAFPAVPLRVLIESGAWERVSDGGMSDEEFNQLMGPWLSS